ncbi:hypothetical protein RP20_CCG012784 [Aedes albopictus]|nr:hypothetical protein RP20_CCG012784 [Aedes albopictus]
MDRFLTTHLRMFDENRLTLLSSQDLFDEMINFLRVFLTFCGSDVLLMDKFRWNARTWLCFWTLVSFAITLFYTIVFRSDDIYAIMDTLSYSGIAIQGAFKMHGALSRVTRLAFFVIPLYVLFVYQKVVLILHVEIPFVDPDVFSGYVITTAYQVMMIALAIAGILAADMGIMILVLHIVGIVDIFRNKLKELDRMLEDAQYSKQQIHEKVSEICVMHREIIKYEEDLDECYHTTVFVQVLTSVACLSLALFVVYMTNDWTRAMFLAATFFQLLEFCLLGTALTLKNDQAIVAIYHTKWYLLTPSDQKRLMFVLHRSQNAVEMTIGGVALLNMETFVAIMKTIYSYFTMLLTFISNE